MALVYHVYYGWGFPGSSVAKNPLAKAGNADVL